MWPYISYSENVLLYYLFQILFTAKHRSDKLSTVNRYGDQESVLQKCKFYNPRDKDKNASFL